MSLPVLSVVVPCFNEQEVLPETARRLGALLGTLVAQEQVATSSHVCFVDDGSADRTWAIVQALHGEDPRFGGLRLSRNRGHQNALLAGLLTVQGDVVVTIDADLQDDLDAIRTMLLAHRQGADIVYGVRSLRATDTALKRQTARMFYRLLGWLGVDVVFDHADFRLMNRRTIDVLRSYDESNLFLRALIPKLGFTTEIVTYERGERFAGESKYPFRKMLALAVEGVTSFSTRPLRIITLLGLFMSALAMALTIWAIAATVIFQATIPGWASTVIPIYVVCGVQLLSMGVIGEYIGKIYLETKRRPRFHISEVLD